jgi:poly(A) polymerase
MLRAVRLAATLEFSIEDQTAAAIRERAGTIARVSTERIQQELTRMLTEAPRAGQGLALLLDLGLLEVILPEVARMHGQAQPPQFHPEGDVFTHTVLMLDGMQNPNPTLAYAVLLHDIGKPPTATVSIEPDGRERIRFNGHAHEGAIMAQEILRRLKLPNAVIDGATHCVAHHMRFMDVPNMKRSTLRRMVGDPLFPTELELHRLDCLCSHGDLRNYTFLQQFQEALANEPVLPDPWISGHDIMALGILDGPAIGHWHKTAYERQLEGGSASREELLAWLRSEIENGRG